MTRKLLGCFSAFLLIITTSPLLIAASASETQEKTAREERDKKALALVDQIIIETESIRLPENRVRIDVALAGPLWSQDEYRARSLLKQAVASLAEITAAVDNGDREFSSLAQLPALLRQEILQVAAAHDARLAISILRATRPASAQRQPILEAQLEMRLAAQIVSVDPAQALAAGERSLSTSIDHEALNLLYRLRYQDKAAAERFLQSLLNRLRTDISKHPAALSVALALLRSWTESNRPAAEQMPRPTAPEIPLMSLNEEAARELSGLIVRTALAGPDSSRMYPEQISSILEQLKPLSHDVERLSPNQARALQQRIAEYDKLKQMERGAWSKYGELFQSGTVEAMIEASKTAPVQVADGLVHEAARKAINELDAEGARQIIEKISDPWQRAEMTSSLERHLFNRAREQRKLSEARAALSRLPSVEERAVLLAQLAAFESLGEDKSVALQLLGEAEALAGGRAINYSQLAAQLQIARAYEQIDVSKSTAIVEGLIDRVNELAAAALALSGFDLQTQYFRKDEFVINLGGPLGNIIQESARLLGSIARSDFDRSRLIADRFQRSEMRLMALVQIAQAVLTGDRR